MSDGFTCGWPLEGGGVCRRRVSRAGQHCADHRVAQAAARAATARAAHDQRRARPEPIAPPLADEDAAAMFAVLDLHNVAYVVIGGLAAAMWGSDLPRTSDADITPARDPANLDRLASALADLDARLRVPGDPGGVTVPLDRHTFDQDVLCLITRYGPLDISFVPDGTAGYEGLARAAVIRPIGDHPGVRIADLADIIESKSAAGRAKDLAQLPALRRLLHRLRPPG